MRICPAQLYRVSWENVPLSHGKRPQKLPCFAVTKYEVLFGQVKRIYGAKERFLEHPLQPRNKNSHWKCKSCGQILEILLKMLFYFHSVLTNRGKARRRGWQRLWRRSGWGENQQERRRRRPARRRRREKGEMEQLSRDKKGKRGRGDLRLFRAQRGS